MIRRTDPMIFLSRKYIFLLMVFISCSIHAMAQTDYYYYDDYTGKKTPLTLNENKLLVSIPRDHEEISKRICANVKALFTASDNTFDFVFITRSDFEELTSQDFWEEDAKSVIITPGYIHSRNRPYCVHSPRKEETSGITISCRKK